MWRTCLLLIGVLPGVSVPAASQQAGTLRDRLEARIARAPAQAVGLYYRALARPDSMLIGANLRLHAASTMKRKEDDSDSTLYTLVGRNRSVRELLELMITRSSNLATNILIERVGATRAQASARSLGAWSIQVLRGVEDGAAYRAGLNNTTTARDLGVLLAAIAAGRAASRAACDSMLAILGRQEFNEGIPVGVPPGTRVAHKTGWIGEVVYHDAGVVYPPDGGSYVLVVLTGGIKEDSVAHNLVADLSRIVYEMVAR